MVLLLYISPPTERLPDVKRTYPLKPYVRSPEIWKCEEVCILNIAQLLLQPEIARLFMLNVWLALRTIDPPIW